MSETCSRELNIKYHNNLLKSVHTDFNLISDQFLSEHLAKKINKNQLYWYVISEVAKKAHKSVLQGGVLILLL